MKKSKKLLSLLLAISMLLAMSVSAFATEAPAALDTAQVNAYAYMDIDQAPAELKDTILECRRAIVYGNQSWTVNGAASIVNEDGSIVEVPEFSDLFPGWDLDEISNHEPGLFVAPSTAVRSTTSNINFADNVDLVPPSQMENTSPFYHFNGNGNKVYTKALTLPGDMTAYNVGYTNEDTGKDLGWLTLRLGQKSTLTAQNNVRYNVRASSGNAGISGYGFMSVSENPDITLDDIEF